MRFYISHDRTVYSTSNSRWMILVTAALYRMWTYLSFLDPFVATKAAFQPGRLFLMSMRHALTLKICHAEASDVYLSQIRHVVLLTNLISADYVSIQRRRGDDQRTKCFRRGSAPAVENPFMLPLRPARYRITCRASLYGLETCRVREWPKQFWLVAFGDGCFQQLRLRHILRFELQIFVGWWAQHVRDWSSSKEAVVACVNEWLAGNPMDRLSGRLSKY